MSRLVFKAPAALSGRLVFGLSDGPAAPANATLHMAGVLGDMGGVVFVAQAPVRVAVAGALGDMAGSCTVVYASNTSRPAVCAVAVAWQDARPAQAGLVDTWQDAQRRRASAAVRWQRARGASAQIRASWQDAMRARAPLGVTFERADRLASLLASSFANAERVRSQVRSLFEQAQSAGSALQGGFANTLRLREGGTQHFEAAARQSAGVFDRAIDAVRAGALLRGVFQQAVHAPAGLYIPPPIIPAGTCYVPGARLLFAEPTLEGVAARLVFVCERHGPGPNPEPGATVVMQIQRTSIVFNSISLHRVDTGAELHAHSFSMSLDYQSWTWSWSASLHQDAAAHLGRDSQGDPAELAVVVNGIPFRLRLESVTRDRRFSPTRWAVSGKGKASILGADYAPRMSFGNTAPRTAQQLMADALTINGVSLGWSVDWGLTDWLVPAAAWALQGSYIDAVNDIAAAAGGYVQPHPTDAVLRVLPRYPAAPWNWDSITPDFEIPADAAEVEGTQYIDKPAYNKVFVGGVGAGVFGPFKRAGTAGNILAPQVTHPLITHADAHRQRGLAELSDTGRQEHVTLKMQVRPETGVITPGQFVRYVGDKTVMGIVRSTSIDWSRPVLRQTIGIETHA